MILMFSMKMNKVCFAVCFFLVLGVSVPGAPVKARGKNPHIVRDGQFSVFPRVAETSVPSVTPFGVWVPPVVEKPKPAVKVKDKVEKVSKADAAAAWKSKAERIASELAIQGVSFGGVPCVFVKGELIVEGEEIPEFSKAGAQIGRDSVEGKVSRPVLKSITREHIVIEVEGRDYEKPWPEELKGNFF
jgi:hypothetical protein